VELTRLDGRQGRHKGKYEIYLGWTRSTGNLGREKLAKKYYDKLFKFDNGYNGKHIIEVNLTKVFLVGLASMVLVRTLMKNFVRYNKDKEMDDERDLGDGWYGWKNIHGDVFRSSSHPILFTTIIDCGSQCYHLRHHWRSLY
jgi:Endomembrane protein 70